MGTLHLPFDVCGFSMYAAKNECILFFQRTHRRFPIIVFWPIKYSRQSRNWKPKLENLRTLRTKVKRESWPGRRVLQESSKQKWMVNKRRWKHRYRNRRKKRK
uniref:Uncharacterized protein n=1 Tax=Parascaris univalens TaxID=6257 RepID=A0A915A4B1_PARUN